MLQIAASALLALGSATQPLAEDLLDEKGLSAALEEIARSPRVRVEIIGETAGGRAIPMAIVARPDVLKRLDQHLERAAQLAGPVIDRNGLGPARRVDRDLDALLDGTALPVLFAGASWGNEASAVEGLVAAARTLATDESAGVQAALSGTIALIVPLMNPDGRAAALAEWAATPRSNGNSGIANGAGFLLNRDFVHATQPESQALVRTVLRYRPVIAVDLHEDVYNLGVRTPEVAFVEPFVPGFDVEEHPASRDAILGAGTAIAGRWAERGYRVLFDPDGDNRFAPMPARGEGINPVASSAGRLNLMASLHGVASFITESARTPGSQSWQDRVMQKSDAVLATLQAVSAEPARYARAVYQRRSDRLAEIGDRFVVIPEADAPAAGRARLIELLRLHDIEVYRVERPRPALVVPLAQPEGEMAQHLLAPVRSVLNRVPPALGLTALPSESLDPDSRSAYRAARLEVAAPPSVESRPVEGHIDPVVLYTGQGVAHHDWAEIAWILDRAGVGYREAGEAELAAALGGAGTLIVPNGSAAEIVTGWDDAATVRAGPWQPAEASAGIGQAGLDAIRTFVAGGGSYVGIGGGGAALAGERYLALSETSPVPAAVGLGPVILDVTEPGSRLLDGVSTGPDTLTAYFVAPPGGPAEGFAFQAGKGAVLRYGSAVAWPDEQAFVSTEPLSRNSGLAAVVHERHGQGEVVLFGIEPAFRGQWPSTARMVLNALRRK